MVLLWLWLALAAPMQVGSGAITGIVADPGGASVPGASVTILNVATGQQRTIVSSRDGVFAATGLPPGDYRVDVALDGFSTVSRTGLRITTGETTRADVQLPAGRISEQVTVSSPTALLRTESASLGSIVPHERVTALPLNGRTFITLASLAPGVALPPGLQLPRINGGRPRTNEYLFDGISVLQPEPGQVAYYPVIDAIQEFKIESNSPPAEFGRFNGGVVNLSSRSGSNTLHGSIWDFFRNEALNARNYFAPASQEKPEFRRN